MKLLESFFAPGFNQVFNALDKLDVWEYHQQRWAMMSEGSQRTPNRLHSKDFWDQQTSKWDCHQILGGLKSEKLQEALGFQK